MKQTLIILFLLTTLNALPQAALAQTTTTATPSVSNLKEYTGSYVFADGSPLGTFTITEKDGEIYGEADSLGSNKLLKQPETDTYKSTSSYGSIIVFNRDPATRAVTGLVLKVQGQEITARKEAK